MATVRDQRLQSAFESVESEIDALFSDDKHPVNDGSVTSMADFLAVMRDGDDSDNFPEIKTAEQRTSAAKQLNRYKTGRKVVAHGEPVSTKNNSAPSPS